MPQTPPAAPEALPWADVTLTPLEAADLDLVHGWQNDPGIRDLTMGFRFPLGREAVAGWIAGLSGNTARAVYAIRHAGQAVGMVQLYDIAPVHRRAALGLFVADPGFRGRGIGHVAACLILDFAFSGLDLRRVDLGVLAGNGAAIRLYETLGFVREGVKRADYFADGAVWDTVMYGLLRAEFRRPPPPQAHRLCHPLAPLA